MISTTIPGPQFVSNAQAPQLIDYAAKALGFAMLFHVVGTSTNVGFGSEYQFGTHQKAIYESQFKGAIFKTAFGNVPSNDVKFIQGAPQQKDFTLQAQLFAPMVRQSEGIGAQYTFGTHAKTLFDQSAKSQVWPSQRAAPGSQMGPTFFTVPPQKFDHTLQGWNKIVPVATGWISTMVTAGPQLADLTLPAKVQASQILLILAPYTPKTIFSVGQENPRQLMGQVFKPSASFARPQQLSAFLARQENPTQIQPQLFPVTLAPPIPSHFVQPAILLVGEQAYQNIYLQPMAMPVIGGAGPPPPLTGFRVMAVTAGVYGGVYRTPGDVFDINYATEYSDSTIDYQPASSATVGFGWMMQVAPTTPLLNWLESNGAPYMPPQDPFRRFVY